MRVPLAGRARRAAASTASVRVPPDIDVLVRNSRVLYLDAARSVAWDFQDVAASLRRDDDVLTLEASAARRPSSRAASRSRHRPFVADATMPARRSRGDWRLSADSTTSTSPSRRACSGHRPWRRKRAAATWPSGSIGTAAWSTSGTVELELADVAVAERPRRRRFALRAHRVVGRLAAHRARPGSSRCATWPSRAAGRAWPEAATVDIDVERDADGVEQFALRSSFLRLEDLTPFFAPLPESRLLESWFALAPRGDLRAVDIALTRTRDDRIDYTRVGRLRGARHRDIRRRARHHGAHGPSSRRLAHGTARARERGRGARLAGVCSAAPLDVPELRGIVVWRAGQDAVRVVSDDLLVVTPAASLRTDLELTLPMDESSPTLDLRTTVSEFDLAAVSRYLPANKMPRDRRRVARFGAARRASDEHARSRSSGRSAHFRSTAAKASSTRPCKSRTVQLAFVGDWPLAEDLDGTVEFANARVRGARQRPRARQSDGRPPRRDRRSARRRLHAAGRHDRRARSSARVPERCAVDRAVPRRGFRAARSPGRHRRREPRSCGSAARPRRVPI